MQRVYPLQKVMSFDFFPPTVCDPNSQVGKNVLLILTKDLPNFQPLQYISEFETE